uniref:Uncharacterized protein n=1 Tax=Bionectria ochroleuca TaxID=29856 RepID=A0A8H7N9K4_BIOOC
MARRQRRAARRHLLHRRPGKHPNQRDLPPPRRPPGLQAPGPPHLRGARRLPAPRVALHHRHHRRRPPLHQLLPVALVDELSEKLGSAATPMVAVSNPSAEEGSLVVANSYRRPLIGGPGGINDETPIERRDELIAKILKPFFGQLSIMAFESTYAMGVLDREVCEGGCLGIYLMTAL